MLTDQERADRAMLEADLQARVVRIAHKRGWRVVHFHQAVVAENAVGEAVWATPVSADAKDFPDLLLVKAGRQPIFAELKRELESTGRLRPGQLEWLRLLQAAGQVAVVWRPSDLPAIRAVLR